MWQPNSPYPGFRFFAQHNICAGKIELFMAQGEDIGYVPETILMVKRDDPGSIIPPLIKLSEIEAQGLMDALWQTGLRPSSRACESDLVQAKNEHIRDLNHVLGRVTGNFGLEIERAG